MKTKNTTLKLNAKNIFLVNNIYIPNFQRGYEWGSEKDNRYDAIKYLTEFLVNKNAPNWGGSIGVYSEYGDDFEKNYNWIKNKEESDNEYNNNLINKQNDLKTFVFKIIDGQHRLTTIQIAIIATHFIYETYNLKTELQHFLPKEITKYDKESLYYNFDTICISTKKVDAIEKKHTLKNILLDVNKVGDKLFKTMDQINDEIDKLKQTLNKTSTGNKNYNSIIKKIKELEDIKLSDGKSFKKEYIKTLLNEKTLKGIKEKSGVINSYIDILTYFYFYCVLFRKVLDKIDDLLIRYIEIEFSFNIFQKEDKNSTESLENYVIDLFLNSNGKSRQVKSGVIFRDSVMKAVSYDKSLLSLDIYKQLMVEENKLTEILKGYKLTEIDSISEFVQKSRSKKWSEKNFDWASNLSYLKIDEVKIFNTYLECLEIFENSLKNPNIGKEYREIWKIIKLLPTKMTERKCALIVRVILKEFGINIFKDSDLNNYKQNIKTTISDDLVIKIVKYNIFLILWDSYIEKGKPNHSRDLHDIETINDIFIRTAKHFNECKNIDSLKNTLIKHIESFNFGKGHREVGKLILFTEFISRNPNSINTLINLNEIHYEHVYSSKNNISKNLKELNKLVQASLITQSDSNRYEALYSEDLKDYVDLIGNATLLNGKANSSISNNCPVVKFILTEQPIKHSKKVSVASWLDWNKTNQNNKEWTDYFIDSNGMKENTKTVKGQIQQNSITTANNFVDWLFIGLIEDDFKKKK